MNEKQTEWVWITKYALTKGIEKREVYQSQGFPELATDVRHQLLTYHGEGREWHRTRESALKRAEDMRLRKLQSLRKQIAKFESWTFDAPE